MTTNVQVITDALRLISVLSEVETASAEQGEHALRVMNQMIEAWDEDGIRLGYFAQSSASATCPIPAWAEKGVTAALAIDLAPGYGATVSVELAAQYDSGMATIKRRCMNGALVGADMSHLPAGSLGRYNIDTDQ